MTRSPKRTVTVASEGVTVIGWSGPGTRTCFSVMQGKPASAYVDSLGGGASSAISPRGGPGLPTLAVLLVLGMQHRQEPNAARARARTADDAAGRAARGTGVSR